MNGALITVAIPFFNAASTLQDAIRSVFAQTEPRWRLLLIDDGSRDESLRIARAVSDPRVTVVTDGTNRGLSYRLNESARLTGTTYLARMDADDLMHPERLAVQLGALQSSPSLDIVGTATYTVSGDLVPTGIRGEARPQYAIPAVLKRGLFVHPTVSGRTTWFRDNPYDDDFPRAEDVSLWCRTVQAMRGACITLPLHFYREPVPVNTRAYLRSSKSVRALLRHYGEALPAYSRYVELSKRLILDAAYRCGGTPAHNLLLRRRSRRLSTDEAAEALTHIGRIRATPVPGCD
jgi:glycosyltransferase involved in cell wall biosynthesis